MATTPQAFPPLPNVAIASYNYTDVADGTGIRKFYAGRGMLSGATSQYFLTTDTDLNGFHALSPTGNYNVSGEFFASQLATDSAAVADLDFDLEPFNMPVALKGKMSFSIPALLGQNSTTTSAYFKVYLRKVSGGAESEIVSATTGTVSSNKPVYCQFSASMTVPYTHFKSGDTLRVTLEFHAYGEVGISSGFAFEPSNSYGINVWNSTTASAGMRSGRTVLNIPFVIDL
jgi:hypothetical protein